MAYHAAETRFKEAPTDDDEPEATYDAGAWNYQIVNDTDDMLVLCTNAKHRDHILTLLQNNPFPE